MSEEVLKLTVASLRLLREHISLGQEPTPEATAQLEFCRLLNDNKFGKVLSAKVRTKLPTCAS